ncbi:YceI family protein [Amycolatopsis sp.]|jgi:polyisoprenoid-binding protein YceI|uniref:YceI family protein n=1 Tax=Amycolatopsis sp. TaxID=37632 RepID=UPI002E00D4A8|nr:YceI family protein [Amycolatopsis sp.]
MSETTTNSVAETTIPGWIAGTWTVDPTHSVVGFSVRHLMSKVRGRFTDFTVQIVTTDDPARSSVTAAIELSSVDTGVTMRDDHLRSSDIFKVEQNPTMRFASTGLRRDGEAWVLTGDLTIGETTRPVDIELSLLGIDPTGIQGETRIGFEGRATIKRSDFGFGFGLAVDGSKIVIGDKIEVSLDIEGVLEA